MSCEADFQDNMEMDNTRTKRVRERSPILASTSKAKKQATIAPFTLESIPQSLTDSLIDSFPTIQEETWFESAAEVVCTYTERTRLPIHSLEGIWKDRRVWLGPGSLAYKYLPFSPHPEDLFQTTDLTALVDEMMKNEDLYVCDRFFSLEETDLISLLKQIFTTVAYLTDKITYVQRSVKLDTVPDYLALQVNFPFFSAGLPILPGLDYCLNQINMAQARKSMAVYTLLLKASHTREMAKIELIVAQLFMKGWDQKRIGTVVWEGFRRRTHPKQGNLEKPYDGHLMMRSGQTSHRYGDFYKNPQEGTFNTILSTVNTVLNRGQPEQPQPEQGAQAIQRAPRNVLQPEDDDDVNPNQGMRPPPPPPPKKIPLQVQINQRNEGANLRQQYNDRDTSTQGRGRQGFNNGDGFRNDWRSSSRNGGNRLQQKWGNSNYPPRNNNNNRNYRVNNNNNSNYRYNNNRGTNKNNYRGKNNNYNYRDNNNNTYGGNNNNTYRGNNNNNTYMGNNNNTYRGNNNNTYRGNDNRGGNNDNFFQNNRNRVDPDRHQQDATGDLRNNNTRQQNNPDNDREWQDGGQRRSSRKGIPDRRRDD